MTFDGASWATALQTFVDGKLTVLVAAIVSISVGVFFVLLVKQFVSRASGDDRGIHKYNPANDPESYGLPDVDDYYDEGFGVYTHRKTGEEYTGDFEEPERGADDYDDDEPYESTSFFGLT